MDEDPAAARSRYGYRLLDATAAESPVRSGGTDTPAAGVGLLSEQQRRVLVALCAAPGHVATAPELTAATELEANRIKEATIALIREGYARVAGAGPAPARGGRPPVRYAATPLALAQLGDPDSDPDHTPTAAERPRLRPVAPVPEEAAS